MRFVADEARNVTTDQRFDLGTEEVTIHDAALAKGSKGTPFKSPARAQIFGRAMVRAGRNMGDPSLREAGRRLLAEVAECLAASPSPTTSSGLALGIERGFVQNVAATDSYCCTFPHA